MSVADNYTKYIATTNLILSSTASVILIFHAAVNCNLIGFKDFWDGYAGTSTVGLHNRQS
jgi:hypothetical protein